VNTVRMLGAFVLVVSGCKFSDDANSGDRCGDAGACPEGHECYRGFCVPMPDRDCDDEGLMVDCYTGEDGTIGIGVCRPGQRTCTGGAWTDCVGQITPRLEICNDDDDDCDGRTDELAESQCSTGALGVCAEGTLSCEDGAARCAPVAVASDETCDARDEDCDGEVDEGLDRACYPTGVQGCVANGEDFDCTGVCQAGILACSEGGFGTCSGAVTPTSTVDSCTGPTDLATDDDCDGQTDEDCACVPGTTQRCYTGPVGTMGVGTCREGVQRCLVEGGGSRLGPCEGVELPTAETCANPGTDDDCDGTVDDVRGLGASCMVAGARGACVSGTRRCVGGALECVGPMPGTDRCEGSDEDCDGRVDEDFDLSSDAMNCGACGVRCGAGQTCCDGTCVDLDTNASHCGTCSRSCGAGIACCGGACTNTTNDAMHCGACGRACAAGTACCGGACVELGTDSNNCGSCGRSCAGGERCCGRVCAAPTAPVCTGCPTDCSLTGQTCCSGVCVDVAANPFHCGMCGRACAAGELCCAGSCVPTGPAHCGACGRACGTGETCAASTCCAASSVCAGRCVDLMNDSMNCGRCGNACTAPATCRGGCCCVGTTCDCGVMP
jgi:hypothetical protein